MWVHVTSACPGAVKTHVRTCGENYMRNKITYELCEYLDVGFVFILSGMCNRKNKL